MGYMDIPLLYKAQEILLFKRCFATEKCHGTSANLSWNNGKLGFFSGGEKYEKFVGLFDQDALTKVFTNNFGTDIKVKVHGEAYGGKQQGMSHTYGPNLKFIAFDIRVGESWLSVPKAEKVASDLGLEFVYYQEIPTDLAEIDAQRDADSVQAVRNGMGPGHMREGVVLRPPIEVTMNNGERIIAKHKRTEFAERQHVPKVVDPTKMEIIIKAQDIADEWVVPMRLAHILQELPHATGMEHTGEIVKAMIRDVRKEAKGEIAEGKEIDAAIGRAAAKLWKQHVAGCQKPNEPGWDIRDFQSRIPLIHWWRK
jgi:hypothetical protein